MMNIYTSTNKLQNDVLNVGLSLLVSIPQCNYVIIYIAIVIMNSPLTEKHNVLQHQISIHPRGMCQGQIQGVDDVSLGMMMFLGQIKKVPSNISILIKHESCLSVCLFVRVFRSHQKSQAHEILALGLIWANLKHVEARFLKF